MNYYKIKISCTSIHDLFYCNQKISDKIIKKSILKKIKQNFYYIESIVILHKILPTNFTIKTLEFVCNKEINDIEFKTFIQYMIDIGFYSKNNSIIQFISNNKPLIEYKFHSIYSNYVENYNQMYIIEKYKDISISCENNSEKWKKYMPYKLFYKEKQIYCLNYNYEYIGNNVNIAIGYKPNQSYYLYNRDFKPWLNETKKELYFKNMYDFIEKGPNVEIKKMDDLDDDLNDDLDDDLNDDLDDDLNDDLDDDLNDDLDDDLNDDLEVETETDDDDSSDETEIDDYPKPYDNSLLSKSIPMISFLFMILSCLIFFK
jgi:hypothetical protein